MKNKKVCIYLFIILLLMIVAIIWTRLWPSSPITDIINTIDSINTTKATKSKTISLKTLEPPGPVNPNYIVRFFNIGDKENYIFLNFDLAINGNESLENFKNYLQTDHTVINITLPEKKTLFGMDSTPTISDFDPSVRENLKIDLQSYDNGKLTGVLTTRARQANYWVKSQSGDCHNDDQVGICVKSLPIDIDLIINFEVQVK